MDRYDRVMNDVLQKTDDESLAWKAVTPERFSDVVLNTRRVDRAFAADYPIGATRYRLLFVDKKIEVIDDSETFIAGGKTYQLIILDEDGQMVLNLYDGVVDRDDLLRLSGLIEAHNNLAKKFFEAFDQIGQA